MNQKSQDSNQTAPKDFVKDIFDRPKTEKDKISTIFTYFRHSPKLASPGPKGIALPSSLKPLPTAIDIGASSIKLLQMAEGKDERMEIVCIDEEALPAGAESKDSMRLALKRIISRNRVGHSCVTTISASDVHLYNMLFPPMPADELVNAVNYKISQLKPFDSDIEKLVVRYSKWGDAAAPKGAPQKIVVACALRSVVENRISLFHELGIRLLLIGISPFELVNLSPYYKPGAAKDEVTLWIDLGDTNTFLAIERGGSLSFSRNLTVSSKHLTKALAQYAAVKEEEAEELKRNYGLIFWSPDKKIPAYYEPTKSPEETEDKSEKVYYGLISHAENLVVDIMHSFKYFSYQAAQSQITRFHRVVLCGGGANLKHMDQFLSVRLGVPVERINTFGLFRPADDMQTRRKDLMGASSNFAVCAGLAVGQKKERTRQINLIAKEEKPGFKIFSSVLKAAPAAAAIIAIVAGVSLTLAQMQKVGQYRGEMNLLTKKVTRLKSQLGDIQARQLELGKEEAGLLSKKKLLEARFNLVHESLRRPEDFSALLTSVAKLMPENAWVTRVSYKAGKLTITGSTIDTEFIARLIEDIKSSKEFSDADFNYTEKDPNTDIYNFEIVADVRT